ncbi:hypothetical protein D3C87_1874310 [compost metagenome]
MFCCRVLPNPSACAWRQSCLRQRATTMSRRSFARHWNVAQSCFVTGFLIPHVSIRVRPAIWSRISSRRCNALLLMASYRN